MRKLAIPILAVAALALAGCGNHNLILKIDLLSYITPADRQVTFPTPNHTGGVPIAAAIVPDETINLLEGLNSAAEVKSVTVTGAVAVSVNPGSPAGTGAIRVYLSEATVDPSTTTPLVDQPIALSVGQQTVPIRLDSSNPAVAELFANRQMRLRVVLELSNPSTTADITGSAALTSLEAVVIAGKKAF